MSLNPSGVILLIAGIVAVIVGVRGTQSKVFVALTGKSSTTGAAAIPSTSPGFVGTPFLPAGSPGQGSAIPVGGVGRF